MAMGYRVEKGRKRGGQRGEGGDLVDEGEDAARWVPPGEAAALGQLRQLLDLLQGLHLVPVHLRGTAAAKGRGG